MFKIPKVAFVSGGTGTAPKPLGLLAFDRALADAGVADYNHLRVSSILAPSIQIVEGAPDWPKGALVPTVYSRADGEEGEEISACISMAIPTDPTVNGVIFEVAGKMSQERAAGLASEMAILAMQDRHLQIADLKYVSRSMVVPKGCCGSVIVTVVMQ